MTKLGAIILAAGKGTRMKSKLPKVLHKVCGRPMLQQVIDAVKSAGIDKVVVVIGHGAEQVRDQVGSEVEFAMQNEQLGTGHAVQQAEAFFAGFGGTVLVLCGDTPLVTIETIKALAAHHAQDKAAVTVLTALMDDPSGYGRIIRNEDHRIDRIVEHKDAKPAELAVHEVNTGAYCFNGGELFKALKEIKPANTQGEYYLTDTLEIIKKKGQIISAKIIADPQEMMGINDRIQLAQAGLLLNKRIVENQMREGVTIIDPATTWIDQDVIIGRDTIIYPNTIIEGNSNIGEDCIIGPNTRLVGVRVEAGVEIQHSTVLESSIGEEATVGPYAYIRPGSSIGKQAKVGDFVEIKKTILGNGSKVPHLSYIGDSIIGDKVNIGAGTITCNYDGKNKHQTTIADGAFIGSNTNLVAPVEVGPKAVVAAGSTITKNVPGEALGVARSKQNNIDNWVNRKKDY